MPAQTVINLGDLPVTVRAITARELYDWQIEIEAKASGKVTCISAYDLFFDDCGLEDLARMTDQPVDVLAEYSHDELLPVLEAARGLNKPFFRLRAVMAEQAMAVKALQLAEAHERLRAPSLD